MGKLISVCLILFCLSGCYLLKQGRGQLDLRLNQVSLEEAIVQESNPEYRHLFEQIPRIKSFAETRLLLRKSENYTGYYRTTQRGVTFVVTASPKTKLKAYTWWFPILGSVPYKGYFNQKEAEALALELQEQGYDTWVFAAPTYSTLGWFKDPVTTPMMRRGHYYLASTIIHEMTHETLFVQDEVSFNEQLASFVGRQGALLYFKEVHRFSQKQLDALMENVRKSGRFAETVRRYLPRFQNVYNIQQPESSKLEQRKKLFSDLSREISQLYPNLPEDRKKFNNARLLQYRRYTPDSPVIRKMWLESNNDWKRFWDLVRAYVDDIKGEEIEGKKRVAGVVENNID